jgi:hypothetical protein
MSAPNEPVSHCAIKGCHKQTKPNLEQVLQINEPYHFSVYSIKQTRIVVVVSDPFRCQ